MMELWSLTDGDKNYPINARKWLGDNQELLHIISPYNKKFLFYTDHAWQGLWKFHPQIPVFGKQNIVTFGEGNTPVVKENIHGKNVRLKLEFLFPTGSYKDRGATVLLSKIKELGIGHVVEDSSGNAGCAIAAYAAKAGITCDIFVAAHASPAKIRQMQGYGARVNLVQGTREDVAEAAKLAAREAYYASHSYNPFFFEGTKTFAYEVWEQCQQMPEEIIFPVGNGTLIIGAFIGFSELITAGLITSMPKLSIAQAAHCPSLSAALPETYQPTVAEGIAVKTPVRKKQITHIMDITKGSYYTINEEDIIKEHASLHRKGYFAELTSAVAVHAISLSGSENILVPLTGHGLKNS